MAYFGNGKFCKMCGVSTFCHNFEIVPFAVGNGAF